MLARSLADACCGCVQTSKRIRQIADDVAKNAQPTADQAKAQVNKLADT